MRGKEMIKIHKKCKIVIFDDTFHWHLDELFAGERSGLSPTNPIHHIPLPLSLSLRSNTIQYPIFHPDRAPQPQLEKNGLRNSTLTSISPFCPKSSNTWTPSRSGLISSSKRQTLPNPSNNPSTSTPTKRSRMCNRQKACLGRSFSMAGPSSSYSFSLVRAFGGA